MNTRCVKLKKTEINWKKARVVGSLSGQRHAALDYGLCRYR